MRGSPVPLLTVAIAATSCLRAPLLGEIDAPSLLAGWKAGAACSAVFVAGRPLAAALQDELGGLPAGAAALPDPELSGSAARVGVRYAEGEPPRIAVHREGFGCTTLPPGASPADAASLPSFPLAPPPDASSLPWPDGDLLPDGESPEGGALERLLLAAFDGRSYGDETKTIGVVVVHQGRIVGERYRPGFGPHTTYRTWSVAKTVTGALIGILIGEGRLALEAPAPIPEWRSPGDPRARITVADLLHMSSGLEEEGAAAEAIYFGGADSIPELTRARLEVAPGTRWLYANRDTLLLVRALRHVLGDDVAYWSFPRRALFDRIGMRHTTAETDWRGNFVLSSQVQTTPRDLARFGLLLLHDGVWNGERVLPEGWVAYLRTPAPARRSGLRGLVRHGPLGLLGYGAQTWLFERSLLVPFEGFGALGSRGQAVTVVPDHDLVVVRTGLDSEPENVFWRQDRFVGDAIEALAHGSRPAGSGNYAPASPPLP
jgi:CubicO group peptidase (beta-lactamase class C family)